MMKGATDEEPRTVFCTVLPVRTVHSLDGSGRAVMRDLARGKAPVTSGPCNVPSGRDGEPLTLVAKWRANRYIAT